MHTSEREKEAAHKRRHRFCIGKKAGGRGRGGEEKKRRRVLERERERGSFDRDKKGDIQARKRKSVYNIEESVIVAELYRKADRQRTSIPGHSASPDTFLQMEKIRRWGDARGEEGCGGGWWRWSSGHGGPGGGGARPGDGRGGCIGLKGG